MTMSEQISDIHQSTQEHIMDEFSLMRETFARMQVDLEDILSAMLKRENIAVSSLSIRIKQKEALRRKIAFKQKYEQLSDITDVMGCRIITLFEDDIERVFGLIEQEFEVIEIVDHRKKALTLTDFGYNSLHVIVRFGPTRTSLMEYAPYANVSFEIQLRSAFQHAWAEVEHGLGYKNEYEVPRVVRRRLARVSATLEILDEEFCQIRDEIDRYNHSINRIEQIMYTDVNLHSLINYIDKSDKAHEVTQTLCDEFDLPMVQDSDLIVRQGLAEKIIFLGVRTIGELDQILSGEKERVLLYGRQWVKLTQPSAINTYFVLLYLLATITIRESDGDGDKPKRNLVDVIYRIGELVKTSKLTDEMKNLQESEEKPQ